MPTYLFWGDDEFRLEQAVRQLRQQVLHPDWLAFNDQRIPPEQTLMGLAQAMTPPFGLGDRLVWMEETRLMQACPEPWLEELERTLRDLPASTHLLFTSSHKPDARLKSTKLLKKVATQQEFPLLASWDSEGILQQVKTQARHMDIQLTAEAAELLSTAIGNDSRKLVMELEKLRLYQGKTVTAITGEMVQSLVPATAYNSFQLAGSLRQGDLDRSLVILQHLLDQNEPALKILSVLVNQFRTWLWVKLLMEQGERDPKVIAQMAEIGNPNRVFFLQKEVQSLGLKPLHSSLKYLLELEYALKQGQSEIEVFSIFLIQIANHFVSSLRTAP
ncbi:MAG: DNA polymerase III subunit delta [Cyanobacteriota bacterium]|nr:DNA polymerase III subunit delta [Cyanobacteriota bacterium]